jgi:hypothetical protein
MADESPPPWAEYADELAEAANEADGQVADTLRLLAEGSLDYEELPPGPARRVLDRARGGDDGGQ